MRILGLDVGTKTIGVAISDELGWTAQGLGTLKRDGTEWERLVELAKQYNVEKVVIGLPKNMDGTIGERGEACRQFAEELSGLLGCSIELWDERLSTVAAEKMLIQADVGRRKRKKVIDKMAACFILQNYLDHISK